MQKADILFTEAVIINKIYTIRGYKVMLDRDLAELYLVDTKRLNEQVKRNLKRFPDDFMFQLTSTEFEILKSQIATSSWGGARKLPFVFTEHGVLMLSSILNSNRAIEVNIQIMRIFSKIRKVLADTSEVRILIDELRRKTENNTKNIEVVFQYLDELIEKQETQITRNKIGFNVNNE
jgi:hypothetical protein